MDGGHLTLHWLKGRKIVVMCSHDNLLLPDEYVISSRLARYVAAKTY